jgi:tetratricopeptide (TPR) repeat protein
MNRRFRLFALFACAPLLRAATIEGFVRDSGGAVVAGATVRVTAGNDSAVVKANRTDAKGHFSISSLPAAAYTLHVAMHRLGEATVGPIVVAENEKKSADLVLKPGIEFFDEPKFTVAGVTQNAYAGGHGSDTTTRSAEVLTKATASLSKEQQPATSNSTEADQHHRNAVAEETQGHSLEAVREFQRAAELNPSETNLFDWGTELLIHGATEAASEVFEKGARLFPGSSRMRLGAAVSNYTQGNYTEAARLFFEATDLNPVDPKPYLFLGKLENPEITESDAFEKRLARFVELLPQNAWANYYYGVSLLKGRTDPNDVKTLSRAQSFLERAVELDPKLAQGFLELGIILLDKREPTAAVQMLNRAVQLDPLLEQAHYRLAQAYRQTSETEKAQAELAKFRKLSTDSSQQLNLERSQLQRFVVTLENPPAN